MKDFERVQVESRGELRSWLEANYMRVESVWLVTYKVHIPDKYVSWDEVVEEALCFGWIDSLPRKLDGDRSMLLLSPRRPGSPWSRLNKKRIEKLLAMDLIKPPGLAVIERAQQDGSWTIYDEVEDLVIPVDLADALAGNKLAERNFNAFSDSSKKGILWWIRSARNSDTYKKRVSETVELAKHNIRANHPEARKFKHQQNQDG